MSDACLHSGEDWEIIWVVGIRVRVVACADVKRHNANSRRKDWRMEGRRKEVCNDATGLVRDSTMRQGDQSWSRAFRLCDRGIRIITIARCYNVLGAILPGSD